MRLRDVTDRPVLFAKFDGRNITVSERLGLAPVDPKTPKEFGVLMKHLGFVHWVAQSWKKTSDVSDPTFYRFVKPEDNYVSWTSNNRFMSSERGLHFMQFWDEEQGMVRGLNPRSVIEIFEEHIREGHDQFYRYSIERPAKGLTLIWMRLGDRDDPPDFIGRRTWDSGEKALMSSLLDLREAGLR